jgi:hypothetical protein
MISIVAFSLPILHTSHPEIPLCATLLPYEDLTSDSHRSALPAEGLPAPSSCWHFLVSVRRRTALGSMNALRCITVMPSLRRTIATIGYDQRVVRALSETHRVVHVIRPTHTEQRRRVMNTGMTRTQHVAILTVALLFAFGSWAAYATDYKPPHFKCYQLAEKGGAPQRGRDAGRSIP